MSEKICTSGIHNDNVCKVETPFLKKNVNTTSRCLKHGRRNNMQLFSNHMKINFLCNQCKDIMCPNDKMNEQKIDRMSANTMKKTFD